MLAGYFHSLSNIRKEQFAFNMKSFWDSLPRPFFVLAPMEAVTDVIFRHVVAAAAPPDVWFTEFTNATGWVHAGDRAIGGRLIKTADEHPIVAQLWGSVPEAIEELSIHCSKLGFDGIDINMGCPDTTAIKTGGGAAMIHNPTLAAEIILKAKNSGLPVSVKTRLGYSKVEEWQPWLTHILSQDIANLTIHLRTKKEMSKVAAHYELIEPIKRLRDEIAPQTLLTINGDVLDRTEGLKLVKKYAVDGVMIGRGIFANPFAFSKQNLLSTENDSSLIKQKINLLDQHLNLFDTYHLQTGRPYDTLKRFFKIYIRDFTGSADLRDKLMHTSTTHEVREILKQLNV